MTKFNERLKILRKEANLSQEELAKKIGVSKSSVNMYERGEREPGFETLEAIADCFNADMDFLLGKSNCKNRYEWAKCKAVQIPTATNIIPMPEAKSIPLVGKIACGTPITATENLEGYIKIPAQLEADFALVCRGDSMVGARIMDGDFVAIRQQPDVDDGDIAAVLIEDEATLKRVYKMPGRLVLRAENPRYAPIDLSGAELDDVRILGKVVYFISEVN